MQNILITGGAGYIGSHMVLALLDAGLNNITVLDNLSTGVRRAVPAGIDFIEADVGNANHIADILTEKNIDTIFHFAGSVSVSESVKNPAKYHTNNTSNTAILAREVVKYAEENDKTVQFIFSSTAAVYGPSDKPVAENAPLAPATPYGESKLRAEAGLFLLSQQHPCFKLGVLRYFNVVGADVLGRAGLWGTGESLMQYANDVAVGKTEKLHIFGTDYDTPDGTAVRDFIHVSDLIAAHMALAQKMAACQIEASDNQKNKAENNTPERFLLNVGYGQGSSVRDVVKAYSNVLERDFPTQDAPRREGDLGSVIADVTQLNQTLNWSPTYKGDLTGMVKTGIAWARRMPKA